MIIFIGVLIVIMTVLIYLSFLHQYKLKDVETNKYNSYLLADRLRQSSDDLTRMVRTYAVTGDPLFKEQFYKVLGIRNGILNRPDNYHRIYWDLIINSKDEAPFINLNETISLRELMKESGFVEDEFLLLEESEINSNKLVLLEEEAMNSLIGLFKDKNSEYTIKGKPDKIKAINILHGIEYHNAKKSVMEPINTFFKVLEERTSAQLKKQRDIVFLLMYSLIFVLALIVVMVPLLFTTNKKHYKVLLEISNMQLRKIKESEKELKRKHDQLIIKNKELSHFTYIASHDLQEPLNTIISFSKLLKEDYSDKLEGIGHQSIEIIDDTAIRMRNLILGLLEYSRIGKNIKLKKVDVKKLVEEIKIDLSDLIEKKDAKIIYNDLSVISAYQIELRMMFLNLITNAIKYSKDDISPKIEIKFKETDKKYLYTVSDNGIGIDMQFKNKIFEVYQRLHTNEQYSGTGIGLANCSRIAELHKGKIWVKSGINNGSKFSFTISKNL